MHGRPRRSAGSGDEDAVTKQKAAAYKKLSGSVISHMHKKRYDVESMGLAAKLLEVNPEFLTVWNYRRAAMVSHFPFLANTFAAPLEPPEQTGTEAEDEEENASSGRHSEAACSVESVTDGQESRDSTAAEAGQEASTPSIEERLLAVVEAELAVSEAALRRNPKAYGAWFHRKWVLDATTARGRIESEAAAKRFGAIKTRELALCEKLLAADSRNFHGWDYRRSVVKLLKRTTTDEIAYTTQLINRNFSNFSAWHYRSSLLRSEAVAALADAQSEELDRGFAAGGVELKVLLLPKLVEEELELTRQALYTEPDDQSAWLYHRWLTAQLVWSFTSGDDTRKQWAEATAERELLSCRELLDLEPDSKWAALTLATLLQVTSKADAAAEKEVADIYVRLESTDPMRAARYLEAAATAASGVIVAR